MAFKNLNTTGAVSTSDSQYSLATSYQLDQSENDVTLSLVFGPVGVATMSKIKLEDSVLAAGAIGSVNAMVIGKNKDLDAKFLSLYIIITVTGATPVPAQVTLDLSLSGGVQSYQHSLTHTVGASGGSVLFIVDVFLTT